MKRRVSAGDEKEPSSSHDSHLSKDLVARIHAVLDVWPELAEERVDDEGRFLIHFAVMGGVWEAVETLLRRGTAWDCQNYAWVTAGEVALQAKHQHVFDSLVAWAAAA